MHVDVYNYIAIDVVTSDSAWYNRLCNVIQVYAVGFFSGGWYYFANGAIFYYFIL